jgi:hypothetical protein
MSDAGQTPRAGAETVQSQRPSPTSWLLVAIAWTLVGVPLLWGIYRTLLNAKVLFG